VSILNKKGFAPVLTEEEIQQAKAMHKEEIEEAFTRGLITEDVYYGYDDKKEEKYYNEKFGGDDE
jgi:hypothetical protein